MKPLSISRIWTYLHCDEEPPKYYNYDYTKGRNGECFYPKIRFKSRMLSLLLFLIMENLVNAEIQEK